MYRSYYRMTSNPFFKEIKVKDSYKSEDYKQVNSRLKYLNEIKGIGLITGEVGSGKTYTIRCFLDGLNKDLYKIIYISSSEDLTVFDFYKIIADELGVKIGSCYRQDLYKNIQNEIIRLVTKENKKTIIFIDDAHKLKKEILRNLKNIYEFEQDSKDYTVLILSGNSDLNTILNKKYNESLSQRIIIRYKMKGLTRKEVKEYVTTRLELADVYKEIFKEEAINALYSCSAGLVRILNSLIINCLILGYQNKLDVIDTEIVMNAKEELEMG